MSNVSKTKYDQLNLISPKSFIRQTGANLALFFGVDLEVKKIFFLNLKIYTSILISRYIIYNYNKYFYNIQDSYNF